MITKNELAIDTYEEACDLVEILIKNGYACLLTREEDLYIVNYVYTSEGSANRNEVVFLSQDEYLKLFNGD